MGRNVRSGRKCKVRIPGHKKGEPRVKVSREDHPKMVAMADAGHFYSEIAKEFGIATQTASRIIRTWRRENGIM
jgi:transposase-like protein